MTMTSTYDHRVIQGAESGSFLRRIDQLLQGEDGFYDSVVESLGVSLEAPEETAAPATAAEPVPGAGRQRRSQRGAAPSGAGRHLGREGPPHPRTPGRHARPARLATPRRPRARPRVGQPHRRADARHPRQRAAGGGPGRDVRRRPAPPARDLLRHDRLRGRAHRRPQPACVAAPADRVRRAPQAARRRAQEAAAQAAVRSRGARDLPAQGLPGQEAVLHRGPGRAAAHARRGDRDRHRGRRPGRRARDGPPRPAERAGPHGRARPTRASWPSSRASSAWRPTPSSPRAAPATSSTTTAPRGPSARRADAA